MIYANLGGVDIKVSRIGFGCWQLGGHGWGKISEAEVVKAVDTAIDNGINIFDTAPIYGLGHSEELLGKILGSRRKNVIIATKVGLLWEKNQTFRKLTDNSPANIEREIDANLKRLRTDYIDIYQVHWPDPNTPIQDTMGTMQKLKKSGKIRLIGCCNFPLGLLMEALKYGQIDTVQVAYNLIDREVENDLLPFCGENGIGVLTYSSIGKGLLAGKYDGNVRFGPEDNRNGHKYFQEPLLQENLKIVDKVKIIANGLNRTPGQVALSWLLENPSVTVALVGFKTPTQLAELIAATELTLSKEDMELLSEQRVEGYY